MRARARARACCGIYLKKEGEISPELINQTDGRFIRPVNNSGRYRGRV
jgi:hypothetical protein